MHNFLLKNKTKILILILFCNYSVFSQSNNSFIKNTHLDSLKIDLSIYIRRDAASFKEFNNLSSKDSVTYNYPIDTILGRARIFKISVNKENSLGNYKHTFIKNIKLEFKNKSNLISIEDELFLRPNKSITIWNGKKSKRPKLLAKSDHVIITLTTVTNKIKNNTKYYVTFK